MLHCDAATQLLAPAQSATLVRTGDYKRERIVLFPTRAAVDRLMHSPILGPPEAKVHYVRQLKWNEQHIMEAVHAAKAEEHKIIGLLFGVLDGVHISLSRPYGEHSHHALCVATFRLLAVLLLSRLLRMCQSSAHGLTAYPGLLWAMPGCLVAQHATYANVSSVSVQWLYMQTMMPIGGCMVVT